MLNFRLVYDKDTGRPKGFGFAEFADGDAAASAVRNLNDYELMGRKLRVDWSNDGGPSDANHQNNHSNYTSNAINGADSAGQHQHQHQPHQQQASSGAAPLPPLPPGADLPPGLTCPDAISRTLSSLPPTQLLDILTQMKALVLTDPGKATELLRQAPQLSYAIFQSLLLLGLVDTSLLASVVETAAQQNTVAAVAPHVAAISHQQQQQQPYLAAYQQAAAAVPAAIPPPHLSSVAPYAMPSATPQLLAAQPFHPPQPVYAQPQSQPTPSKETLIRQVMAMTQQQIDQLAPEYRAQIIALKQQLLAGQGL